MSKPVIPPFTPNSPSGQTVEILEQRLQAAEYDTRELLNRLNGMGVKSEPHPNIPFSPPRHTIPQLDSDNGLMEPFKPRLTDTDLLHTSYDTLVSRLCRTESAIQTLRVSLLNVQSDKDVKRKIYAQVEEKWSSAKQNYEGQLTYLKREVRGLQYELTCENETRTKLKEEVKSLQNALEESTTSRAAVTVAVDDLALSKEKLIRRVNDLKEEIGMETSIRASLEESHNTLLIRIREMETVVEAERGELQNFTNSCHRLKCEVIRLTEELSREKNDSGGLTTRCQELAILRDNLQIQYDRVESERQMAATELSRFRDQYQDLIAQVEKTQIVVDKNKMHMQNVECENQRLSSLLDTASSELTWLRDMHKQEVQVEKTHEEERILLESEAVKLRTRVRETQSENDDLKRKADKLQKDNTVIMSEMTSKDTEFTEAAGGLERELNSLRVQLRSMQDEKHNILSDKENLLEEVNQTVDTLMEERLALQSELDQHKIELETLYSTQRQVEREKADLLDRLSGFEHHQMAQKKVQSTLKEMMEQKNKLAYDSGRLQTEVNQLKDDLEVARRGQVDGNQLRKLNDGLQNKYSNAQKDVSELKVAIQCLESQHKLSEELLQQKDEQLQSVMTNRQQLEKNLEKVVTQLRGMDDRDKHKGMTYQKNLNSAKNVNREIASTLEDVMTSHSQLQTMVESLQVELGKKDTQLSQLRGQKNRDQDDMQLEMRNFEEKMSKLRDDMRNERDKSSKKNCKELAELKKQNDGLSSRNMELVRTNTDLRHRSTEMERTQGDLSQKLLVQKRKMEYLNKAKKHLEDNVIQLKVVRHDIDDLEKMRDEYIRRNTVQGETIQVFMTQIASLQEEIRELAKAQINTSQLLKRKEAALDKEKVLCDDIKKKFGETRKREDVGERKRKNAEGRLKEAHNESLEISQHLQQAHVWFKTKFDKLQTELDVSKKLQMKLEEENAVQRDQLESERYRSQDAAERAKEMIKSSRKTISRLADYADKAEVDTKQQMSQLQADLQLERDVNKKPITATWTS